MIRKKYLLFVLLSPAPLLNLVKSRLPRIYRECLLSGLPCSRALLFILLLCTPALVFSQQRWERTYGGTNDDWGNSVQQTTDGGYIIAGGTYSFGVGNHDVYLIKTNASGNTLWTRTYGGTSEDDGIFVQQTTDGGYIVAGYTNSFGADSEDVYLIKTNASGDTLWTRTYGGTNQDEGWTVQQTSDGGYIIAGYTNSFGAGLYDVYLIKTNASGDTLWTKTYGGTNWDYGSSVQQTSDGGYIIAGGTKSFGAGLYDVYLIKTNASGDTLWTRTYGGTRGDDGFSVQQTSDGGYVIAGGTYSFGAGGMDVYLIKANALGDTLWTRAYGGTNSDFGQSVQQTSDGGYIVAGYTYSFGAGWFDVYLIKTDANGGTLWTKTYGGTDYDAGYSVQQTQDGGYIIAGCTGSFGAGSRDVYLIKTDANGNVGVENNPSSRLTSYASRLTAFPNPFVSFASVPGHETERFNLYDVSGRQVGMYKGDRIGEGLSPGVYFLRSEGKAAKPFRIVKLR